MGLNRAVNAPRRESREDRVLDTVLAYRFYAPRALALDEEQERMLAEAALGRVFDMTEPMMGGPWPTDGVRHRLGSLLMLLGTALQGAPAIETTAPAAPDSGAAAT
jgi:hypothetical protein